MRAEGRCERAIGALLSIGLLLACEQESPGAGAPQPAVAGESSPADPGLGLQRVVDELAASPGMLEPARASTHRSYARLSSASDGELRGLLQHDSPVVRAYAFQALAEHHPRASLFVELCAALGDLAVVSLSGASRVEATVAELALERVEQNLSSSERDAVAGRLLAAGAPQPAIARIKREWTLGGALHEPLRALARAGDAEALPALARYHDAADIPLLAAGLRETTADQALLAIAEFPDVRFVAPLQAFQRRLPALRRELLCQFYATALRFPAPVADELLAAPFTPGAPAADLEAHVTCQRWLLPPDVLRQHVAAGFRLWEHGASLHTEQLQLLWGADPARAQRLISSSVAELGRFSPEAAAWLVERSDAAGRAAALRGLRASLRSAGRGELDDLGDVIRRLELRELLPELFARLERSRPLADADMTTFREEVSRPLVRQISRWPLSEVERRRLLSWVMGGRAARERDTRDPVGQRIVEDYLVDVLSRAGLLRPS